MNIWFSIGGLVFVFFGALLSYIGGKRSASESKQELLTEIRKKDTEISEIKADSRRIVEQNTKLITSNDKLVKQNEDAKKALEEQKFENGFLARLTDLNRHIELITATSAWTREGNTNGYHLGTSELKGVKSFEAFRDIIYGVDNHSYEPCDYATASHNYTYNPNLKASFEPYYNTLATLLTYVEMSELLPSKKMEYFERVIDQMDFIQKKALVYHIALNGNGQNRYDNDLRRLETKYQFFKELRRQEPIAHTYNHNILYHAGIYSEKPNPHAYPK